MRRCSQRNHHQSIIHHPSTIISNNNPNPNRQRLGNSDLCHSCLALKIFFRKYSSFFSLPTMRSCSLLVRTQRQAAGRYYYSTTVRRASSPVVELREYSLKPRHAGAFWKAAEEMAQVRRTMLPLRFYCRPETGEFSL